VTKGVALSKNPSTICFRFFICYFFISIKKKVVGWTCTCLPNKLSYYIKHLYVNRKKPPVSLGKDPERINIILKCQIAKLLSACGWVFFFCRGPPGYVNSVKLKAATVPHHHCSYSNAAAVVRDSVSRSGERGTASWRKSVQNALVYC
jgi:hypothetical protein